MSLNRREFIRQGAILAGTLPLTGALFGSGCLKTALQSKSPVMIEEALFSELSVHQIEHILAEAMGKGGDFAELFFENARSRSLSLQEGLIRNTQIGYRQGVGIRVLSGERTGYAHSDDTSLTNLLEVARTAASIANAQARVTSVSLKRKTVNNHYHVVVSPDDIGMADKVALVKRADEAGLSADSRVRMMAVQYFDLNRTILIANTDGLLVGDTQNDLRIYASAYVFEGDRREQGFHGDGGRRGFEFFDDVSPEDIARFAVERAIKNLDAEPAPSGPMEVVLNGKFAGVLLHEAVGHPLEADFNRQGLSIYSGKLGQMVCPPNVTIVDDGIYNSKEPGTINIDDEGTPGARTVLIENGKLVSYMQDKLNAGIMKLPLTGNGRRQSFRHLPIPRMTNTIMLAGESDPQDIIRSVKKGLYARVISNGQVNISSGDFMFFVDDAAIIEAGQITRRVKGASLIGNGPQVLSKITMVGNDFAMAPSCFACGKEGQMVNVGMGMPTIKVSEITVGGTRS